MKFLSFLIAAIPMAAAFAPLPMQRVAQPSSTAKNMLDPDIVHYLAQNCDATSVQFVNCDDMNCELMMAEKVGESWEFESMGPADPNVWDQKTKIVKMAMDWTE